MSPDEIREVRQRATMTQPEFAAKIGVSVDTVKSWEMGRLHPGPDKIARLRYLANDRTIRVRRLIETLRETAANAEADDMPGLAAQLRRIADNHEASGVDPVQIVTDADARGR